MRVDYDKVADSVYFRLKGERVVESVEISEGVIIDFDERGEICGIEVLAFSKRKLDLNQLVKCGDGELVSKVATT